MIAVTTHNTALKGCLLLNNAGLALNTNFMSRNCICPQDVKNTFSLIYECTTVGPISTTWRGTAFDCPGMGNEILLRHTQFMEPGGTRVSCNNGNIMAMSVRVENNQYTSLLNVTYNPALNGTTVMCVHNNDMVIGESIIPGAISGTYITIIIIIGVIQSELVILLIIDYI